MVNIKVAVRIRSFSRREISQGDDVIVRREGKAILVTNPKIPERQDGGSRQRTWKFVVDFCYDPTEPQTSSQQAVYSEIGLEVLDSMFDGYNACVLAYGHSASGKTYTMMGLQEDPGLTPRICQGLFERMEQKSIRFQILISFLEIYNEKVRDLLSSEEAGATSGNFSLRVREHPKLGPYVQDLSQHLVTDRRELLEFLDIGSKRRSTAATENNLHSSRSHAVFTIQFKQTDEENYETDKLSKVHLVDLAGSLQEVASQEGEPNERASSAQSKARLKEGANINKSLVTLGNVISALAESYETGALQKEHSNSRTWQPFVPYRDSVLTWLLKDTLGGNSNTIMIATVSPASSCLSETINTLRYARRTKRIVNQPIINEDPKIKTIRELREEIARLKSLLGSYHSCHKNYDSSEDPSEFNSSNFQELLSFESTISKWLESGGERVTDCEEDYYKKGILHKLPSERDEVNNNEEETKCTGTEKAKRSKKISDILEVTATRLKGEGQENEANVGKRKFSHIFLGVPRAGSLAGDVCKIDDEKKSDVNGSVIDNLPRETQFFSDSLESFSSLPLKSNNPENIEFEEGGEDSGGKKKCEISLSKASKSALSPKRKWRLCLKREFSTCEILRQKDCGKMLHRSRPDLIKGIATRSKEGIPSTSSQSCTDVSNMSQSTSENSLNSSGSVETQTSENKSQRSLSEKASGAQGKESGDQGQKRGNRGQASQTSLKKKGKRSEIVEAVTTRLYITKKKSEGRIEVPKPVEKEREDDAELEELKLCKRARMKLFDLSRKLAMTRKFKKTVDNDTQTDFQTRTIRLKEKCTATDHGSGLNFENCGTNTSSEDLFPKKNKSCVVMNQVFIPRSSNYVVECGKVMRIEMPEMPCTHELGTQTTLETKTYKNVNTSPIKFISENEESFSDDSLDSEDKSKRLRDDDKPSEKRRDASHDPLYLTRRSYDSLVDSNGKSRALTRCRHFSYECLDLEKTCTLRKEFKLQGLPLVVLTESNSSDRIDETGLRREDVFSSENSFTSVESADVASSSETSSEDFVFYESPKDKDLVLRTQPAGDRELYTITENSEQSEASDVYSPVLSQNSSSNTLERGEKRSKGEMFGARSYSDGPNHAFKSNSTQTDSVEINSLIQTFESLISAYSSKSKGQLLKVPSSGFYLAYDCLPLNLDNVPNDTNTPERPSSDPTSDEGTKNPSAQFSTPKKVNWKDIQTNSQKQFLNFNILESSKASSFTIDTPLFGESSKKDQSTETMFTSQDSITFVFMGPAKPRTSVLMEVIKRSLNKSFEAPFSTQKKTRSKGVQCNTSSLMRSVSVDTALMALSRIARHQQPSQSIPRTISLDTFTSDEMYMTLDQGKFCSFKESSCQCDLESASLNAKIKKSVLKYSVSTNTTRDQPTETLKVEDGEKPKKSVSFGVTKCQQKGMQTSEELSSPYFDLRYCDSFEVEVEESNEENCEDYSSSPDPPRSIDFGRRVRFSTESENLETPLQKEKKEATDSAASMSSFLREATQLLRNLNHFSAHNLDEQYDGLGQESYDKYKSFSKRSTNILYSSRNGRDSICESELSRISKSPTVLAEMKIQDPQTSTWPRRRLPNGKPPSGMRSSASPRFSRSPLPSRSSSIHSHAFSDLAKNGSRMGSTGMGWDSTNWNLSNLSTSFSNSYVGESRASSSRSIHSNEYKSLGNPSWFANRTLPQMLSPKALEHKLNFSAILDLEADLEESCRRLELAVEQDKIRQQLFENRKTRLECGRHVVENCSATDNSEQETESRRLWVGVEPVKRRKTGLCADGCTCKTKTIPCKYLLSKTCHSSFELDSFGPGSNHCHQLCMFCRKKDSEVYCSVPTLNSGCDFSRCRLNFYGYCPCSSVKLEHVAYSPRAYMQHLLTLRRRIVHATKTRAT